MLQPGLVLKQGVFSAGKTSESIRSIRDFDPLEQINITNQPTGYTHILIKSGEDLINVLKDIYNYNLYITGYEEKLEYYNLLKDTLENFDTGNIFEYFPNAKNIPKSHNFLKDYITRIKIKLGFIQTCNLEQGQIEREMLLLDKYFEERKVITDKYGEDLLPGYFNCMILDELHLYFGTRNFKENFKGDNAFLMDFVAFPVKLNTRIEGIAQNVNGLDIVFRRQCSLYMTHVTKFFELFKTTNTYDVQDPEHPVFDDNSLVDIKKTFNWYKIFGYPKLQYYRNHIILANKDDSIYEKGDYFRYISNITENLRKLEVKNENKEKEKEKPPVEKKPLKPKSFDINKVIKR